MKIELQAIGFVTCSRQEAEDDFWGDVVSTITLADHLPEDALLGLDAFSHAEILFHFHKVDKAPVTGAAHPRGNTAWPKFGIFAQRKKRRPNLLGTTTVKVLGVKGRDLKVQGLVAIDGTPILDIKPYFKEFAPREEVRQPVWVSELMSQYWY